MPPTHITTTTKPSALVDMTNTSRRHHHSREKAQLPHQKLFPQRKQMIRTMPAPVPVNNNTPTPSTPFVDLAGTMKVPYETLLSHMSHIEDKSVQTMRADSLFKYQEAFGKIPAPLMFVEWLTGTSKTSIRNRLGNEPSLDEVYKNMSHLKLDFMGGEECKIREEWKMLQKINEYPRIAHRHMPMQYYESDQHRSDRMVKMNKIIGNEQIRIRNGKKQAESARKAETANTGLIDAVLPAYQGTTESQQSTGILDDESAYCFDCTDKDQDDLAAASLTLDDGDESANTTNNLDAPITTEEDAPKSVANLRGTVDDLSDIDSKRNAEIEELKKRMQMIIKSQKKSLEEKDAIIDSHKKRLEEKDAIIDSQKLQIADLKKAAASRVEDDASVMSQNQGRVDEAGTTIQARWVSDTSDSDTDSGKDNAPDIDDDDTNGEGEGEMPSSTSPPKKKKRKYTKKSDNWQHGKNESTLGGGKSDAVTATGDDHDVDSIRDCSTGTSDAESGHADADNSVSLHDNSCTNNSSSLLMSQVEDPGLDPSDDWDIVWSKVKKIGWRKVFGPGLTTEWCYVLPKRKIKGGTEGVDYFIGEQKVLDYCKKNYGRGPNGLATDAGTAKENSPDNDDDLENAAANVVQNDVENASANVVQNDNSCNNNSSSLLMSQVEDPGLDPSDDWDIVWSKLKKIGWRKVFGPGLTTEWCYVLPKRKIKGGTEGVDYFIGEQKVRDYCEKNYGRGPNGLATEAATAIQAFWSSDTSDSEADAGKENSPDIDDDNEEVLDNEVSDSTRDSNTEASHVEIENAAANVVQNDSSRNNNSSNLLMSQIEDPGLDPSDDFNKVWSKLKNIGWYWKYSPVSDMATKYYYVLPKRRIKGGTKGIDYLTSKDEVLNYCKRKYDWKPEGDRKENKKSEERKVRIRKLTDRASEAKKNNEEKRARNNKAKKSIVNCKRNAREASDTAEVTNTIETAGDNSSKKSLLHQNTAIQIKPTATVKKKDPHQSYRDPGLDPSDDIKKVWSKLTNIGWYWKYSAMNDYTTEYYYVLPGRDTKKGYFKGFDYLTSEKEVRDYCERNYDWKPEGGQKENEESEERKVRTRKLTERASEAKGGNEEERMRPRIRRRRPLEEVAVNEPESKKAKTDTFNSKPTAKEQQTKSYAVEEFEKHLDSAAEVLMHGGIGVIEDSSAVTKGNNEINSGDVNPGCGGEQWKAQYGRFYPQAADTLLNHLTEKGKSEIDLLVDIGSGIGAFLFQAAVCFGIRSHGVELMIGRHKVAKQLQEGIMKKNERFVHALENLVQLQCGDFTHAFNGEDSHLMMSFLLGKELEESLGRSPNIVLYANNAQDIFSENFGKDEHRSLDNYLATLFSMAPDGTRLVTFSKVDHHFGGTTSWFEKEELTTAKDAVTWSIDPQTLFIYTKKTSNWCCTGCSMENPIVQNQMPVTGCLECSMRIRIPRSTSAPNKYSL